ncbi:cation:proton antiporter regulatory subunit [Bacillus haynesii]|uniref:cation:proton antiporter regulatory subunit n=1 Tax=Bacillus haynesii TaxID=1925021 RepID=UPI00228141D1|nr:cation:proton antiporter regulatory subunit [Bacillus haynesii]MCY8241182.1 cation:proton antiporter regulatory subunit [Bacillus haynesii]MCY8567301.1 cation:proton antiporter regulatory subunit [Bacillus haynesii]
MKMRESELPGIGKKIEIFTRSADKITIILHEDGTRELYHFHENDDEEYVSNVRFDDDEARQISAILGGMAYKPKALESVEAALDKLMIEWFKIESGSLADQETIGALGIGEHYHVTVIAVVKKDRGKILNPGSVTVISEGDTLIISGERNELTRLMKEKLTASERDV